MIWDQERVGEGMGVTEVGECMQGVCMSVTCQTLFAGHDCSGNKRRGGKGENEVSSLYIKHTRHRCN